LTLVLQRNIVIIQHISIFLTGKLKLLLFRSETPLYRSPAMITQHQ
jgi:hypothetical protein